MAGRRVSAWYVGALALLAHPRTDMDWEAYAPHFWLVRVSAGVSTVLAYATGASVVATG
jgi:adenylate cyclase